MHVMMIPRNIIISVVDDQNVYCMKMPSKHAMMSMLLAIRAKASTAATGKCPFTDHKTLLPIIYISLSLPLAFHGGHSGHGSQGYG